MSNRVLPSLVVTALLAVPLSAQQADPPPPTHLYEAYFKISFADLPAFIESYQQHTVPVMRQLQEEGTIQGWNAWTHETGGEYNWRFAIRTWDWAALGTFWEEYLSRLSAEGMAAGNQMIASHYDEIWGIDDIHVTEGIDTQYMYSSGFQVSFGDLEHWNRAWDHHAAPVLNQGMTDGLLGGWVILSHNTGNRHNWRVLYLFEEWDDMDDLFKRLLDALQSDPHVWETIGRMIQSHEDNIWSPVPIEAGM